MTLNKNLKLKLGVLAALSSLSLLLSTSSAYAQVRPQGQPETGAAAERVWFVQPKDGATVTSPFLVKFGLDGKKIGPLGDMNPALGHHHLVINAMSITDGTPIPADDKHLHYGKGQTEAEISLPAGKYKLTLQFGNGAHLSYGEKMSATIQVTVKEGVKSQKTSQLEIPPSAW